MACGQPKLQRDQCGLIIDEIVRIEVVAELQVTEVDVGEVLALS